ncbi:hypothetical protein [Microtetraspora niveoalba]|uniref:hypothetical protein n=1 Tax=Microtetraspora niveoalba TaxID=46175 RepID=UPI000834214D|nr:hypothetical protein [Microtetraspora niveoalba]
MLPSHREVAAAHLMPYVLNRSRGDRVELEQARDLARAEGPAGAAFAAVLARVLGDPHMPDSVDVLLEVAAREELPAVEIGRQAGLLVASGEVRMIDMIAALDAAARRGAPAQVWRIAASALPTLLPAPGERPRNGLARFVTLAVTVAEWCGARRDPRGARHGRPQGEQPVAPRDPPAARPAHRPHRRGRMITLIGF